MISDGHLEPIMMTPSKKTQHLMLKDNTDPDDKHDPRASDSEAEKDDHKEFGRNMNKWSDLPIAVWKRIFKRWSPKIFTKANINAMVLRGQRETSLKSVHLLAEAMTDITMDETIDISKRTKRKCIDHQIARYTAGGDRAQYIEMPPDWSKCGPYVVEKVKKEAVTVRHRWKI
jgi:hypothetical protein